MEQFEFTQSANNMTTLPHVSDAERSVLGSMLIDAGALEVCLEQLREEDFYVPANATIYAAMRDVRASGNAVDLVTLTAELERHNKLDMAGGLTYLTDLVTFVPTAANVQHYIGLVETKSTQRALIRAGGEIMRDGMDDEKELEDTLNLAEKRIYEISMRKVQGTLVPMEQIVPEAYHLIGELAQRRGKITGIPSGFIELDRMTNGFQKSDLIIVASRPAMGKSSFAMNVAQYAAVHNAKTVVVFSLEMSSEQLVMRMLCTEASVDSQRIKEGLIGNNEMNNLMEVMDPMSRAKIFIDDSSGANVAMIRSKCRRLSARAGLDMIVIDYLQLMQASGSRKDGNRMQEISDMTRQLKLLARELNVPIILLCQLNRGPDTRADHRPVISDLRESGSIEQDADMVILLYRPAAYMDTQEYEMGDNTSQIIIAKHRHGSTGVVKLLWQGEYTRFRSIAQENQ
ncbi:MAG: replicative DNA helicase [Firmicutes bacterium HGW-Firmicutes-9]|jgi:replicative DNA helicase|nr:MAG: replicative DNA helicase [Firmicutes bacterium HGW-Firmicutes-9]